MAARQYTPIEDMGGIKLVILWKGRFSRERPTTNVRSRRKADFVVPSPG
jgi:hypothetical protein